MVLASSSVIKDTKVSIIIPTYNESQNILNILKSIKENLPKNIIAQAVVVDDNSPDHTGKIVENHFKNMKEIANYTVDVIHRKAKKGLSSAIISGIQHATGDTIVVIDSDFSHPPQVIPKLIEAIKKYQCDMVIASRYITGGKILGWPTRRKIISKIGTTIAKKGLNISSTDPMSGFFAFKKTIINELNFDALGYKILLEILVKTKGVKVKEIPYTFQDRKLGKSKLDHKTIFDFCKSVWKLYRYGKSVNQSEQRKSIRFFSKAARFYSVGATGFGVNYIVSLLLSGGISEFWYIHATTIGIIASMTSNFILNKIWTFEDRDFSLRKSLFQYGKFLGFSSIGAVIQLGMVFYLVDGHSLSYPISLGIGVLTGAFSNYILNKKWTFKEKLWG